MISTIRTAFVGLRVGLEVTELVCNYMEALLA